MSTSSSIGHIRIPRLGGIEMRQRLSVMIIILLLVGDCLTGLLFNLNFSFHRVGLVIKSIVILFALFYYAPMIKKKAFLAVYATMLILFATWLISAIVTLTWNPLFSFQYSVVILNRYFFFLILAVMFLHSGYQEGFNISCRRILDWFFVINNSLIFIGMAFGIYWLSSFDPTGMYAGDARYGYKGLIFGNNEIAGIYTIGIAYYFREAFKYRRPKYLLLIFTCVAAVFTGAKAGILALVLIGGYYLVRYRMKYLILLVLPALVGLGILVARYWDLIAEKYLRASIDLFESVDFIHFITSGRDGYLRDKLAFIGEYWSPVNYLIGDAFLYTEMDFFDIYFFFGIGAILYMFIYIRLFFYRDRSVDNLYFFLVFMALAFVAGHVIQSAIVPLFLLLYIFSLKKEPVA